MNASGAPTNESSARRASDDVAAATIALVTCARLPEGDEHDRILVRAFAARNVNARFVVWDDPSIAWSSFTLCLLRSPWDYSERHLEFLAWAERAATESSLYNPLHIVRWNIHKSYLLDLARADVPVVPSIILPAGASVRASDLVKDQGWSDAVFKPIVNAGGFRTIRFGADRDAAEAYLHATLPHEDVVAQPYVPSIETDGETSIVFFDGEPSHTVRKRPAHGEFRIQERFGGVFEPCAPHDDELTAARAVLAAVGDSLPYARVDMARIDGVPHLMELEVIEPSLYFQHADADAPLRLADAVVRRLSGSIRPPPEERAAVTVSSRV